MVHDNDCECGICFHRRDLEQAMKELNVMKRADSSVSANQSAPTGGTKHDSGKPQLSILPIEGLELAARALTYGAEKYSRNNYKKGFKHSRLLDAALRHLNQYASGQLNDSESSLPHLAHALASLNMLAFMVVNKPELDDVGAK